MSATKPNGVAQTGKREYRAWIDHKGGRHTLGTFDRKPEALRIAQGVFHGLHEHTKVIAAKGQIGPFPTWHDKAEPERSADPVFSLDPSLTNQDVTSAEIRGQCNTKGPPGPTSYGAVYEAKRDRWRAWVNWGRSRRWLGRFATKEAAERAVAQAACEVHA